MTFCGRRSKASPAETVVKSKITGAMAPISSRLDWKALGRPSYDAGRQFLLFWENRPERFLWAAQRQGLPLPKTIYTERHKRLLALLKAKRKAAGLTQTVVAKRLGRPPSYFAKYELGDRRLDVLEYLDVAAAIGFDPCELIRSLLRKKG